MACSMSVILMSWWLRSGCIGAIALVRQAIKNLPKLITLSGIVYCTFVALFGYCFKTAYICKSYAY